MRQKSESTVARIRPAPAWEPAPASGNPRGAVPAFRTAPASDSHSESPPVAPSPAGPVVPPPAEEGHRNEIVVAGRITAEPALRELPSGDRLATWRICVARPAETRFRGRRADSITCVSFDPKVHEGVRAWRLGDVVQMAGALRRRTWRGHDGVRSVYEVEVSTVTSVRVARPRTERKQETPR